MTRLLVVVVEEVATLPPDVVDIIISQFLRVDPRSAQTSSGRNKKNVDVQDEKQSNLLLKDYPPAYNMAKAICTSCPEKMTSQISQYFNNVIVDASASKDINGHSKHMGRRISNLDESDDETEDVKELSKAHQLIRELWRACPDVLLNVIPQLEAELSAESVSLRLLATETLGDVAAGIGVSGPPPPAQMDPAAWPPTNILSGEQGFSSLNRLLVPVSPKPFSTTHAAAYESFLSRRQDKSASVRAAWATAVGRMLLTSAGGIGFVGEENQIVMNGVAQMLGDADEKVRLAAIKIVGSFSYPDIISKLGPNGGIAKEGSIMAVLADRVKDRKHTVREQAMKVLGRIWGVASNDIQEGADKVVSILGDAPKKLLDAYYTNDSDVHALLDRVMFELLLPISFPPVKLKPSRPESQRQLSREKESGAQEDDIVDPDVIRVRRILTLVKNLDERCKKVFFAMQVRQISLARIVEVYLKACEQYNGGVVEENEKPVKAQLTNVIEVLAKSFPDSSRVTADLWKFAKLHDRRNYQLIRFTMGVENDYRTVTNAIKEFTKRIQGGATGIVSLLETFTPLLYRCGLIIYNRSHVLGVMKLSRTNEFGLGETAYEVLKEISTRNPEILKTHVRGMCKELEAHAPTADTAEESSAPDTLKACAAFARKFPAEVSKDRKFLVAMTSFALYARSTKAAKHAVSIIMAAAEKKEMYAKDLVHKATEGCLYTSPHFLTRLATISQISLLAPSAANSESDAIIKIALNDTLLTNRAAISKRDSYSWSTSPDNETLAKEWALKILVNRCRAEEDNDESSAFSDIATPLFAILNKLIVDEGELLPSKNTTSVQKSRLRLTAACLLLKLCRHRRGCESLVTSSMFNNVALVALDQLVAVRTGFVNQLKKYLSQNHLNSRWYTILFLLAFEPDTDLQSLTVTWLKSRVLFFTRQHQQAQSQGKSSHQNIMELLFARLLSLLAHHPDFPERGTEVYNDDLVDFAKYICFYLSAIANEDNLSLIFHIAQRIKQTKDAIDDTSEASEHLYVLSDLAQAAIRDYADLMSHQRGHAANVNILQTWPGKLHLPSTLFGPLPSHSVAQEIAAKNFLPADIADDLEHIVKSYVRPVKTGHHSQSSKHVDKKRKSDSKDEDEGHEDEKPAKKAKSSTTTLPVRKASSTRTPKPPKKRKSDDIPSREMPSRKSTRTSHVGTVSYADRNSDEDDAEMDTIDQASSSATKQARRKAGTNGVRINKDGDEGEKENQDRDPTSDEDVATEGHEMDVESSSRETTPSPLRAKGTAAGKKGKMLTHPPESPQSKTRAMSTADSGKETMRKVAAKKKVTPLKTKSSPKGNTNANSNTNAYVRETRRTRA